MKRLNRVLNVVALAAAVYLNPGSASAQERPNRGDFDPEQMRARMMERYRERLDVKSDDEWKLIEQRIAKVMEARRAVGAGGGARMMFGGRPGGGRDGGDDQAGARRRGGMFGGEPNPDAEALQKAIEDKASNEEIKAKLAKYRESRKAAQAKLNDAQEDLRKVLTVRQEATAVLMGLLD